MSGDDEQMLTHDKSFRKRREKVVSREETIHDRHKVHVDKEVNCTNNSLREEEIGHRETQISNRRINQKIKRTKETIQTPIIYSSISTSKHMKE
jgi:hypothetical protein